MNEWELLWEIVYQLLFGVYKTQTIWKFKIGASGRLDFRFVGEDSVVKVILRGLIKIFRDSSFRAAESADPVFEFFSYLKKEQNAVKSERIEYR